MSIRLPIVAVEPELDPGLSGSDDARMLRVGDLAQRTQKTVRALHLYEELGLLRPSERSKGGYRLYGPDAVTRVHWINKLQDMGFSLPDIRDIAGRIETSGSATGAMHQVRALYAQKLADTKTQIQRLAALQEELQRSIEYLDACESCDPVRVVQSCTRCDQDHACDQPELVAGLHKH